MTPTPAIREFLIRLEGLLDERAWPALDRAAVTVTAGPEATLVRLPHRDDPSRSVECEVAERTVTVIYRPERVEFTRRDEALAFVDMLGAGRVVLEVHRGLGWTTMRSYRDGLARPFRRTRMPWPTLRPRTERTAFGFTAG